jgi:hypothetical protein
MFLKCVAGFWTHDQLVATLGLPHDLGVGDRKAERQGIRSWRVAGSNQQLDQASRDEVSLSRIGQALRGWTNWQRASFVPQGCLADPKGDSAIKPVGRLAGPALNMPRNDMGSGNTNRSELPGSVNHHELGGVVPVIECDGKIRRTLDGDLARDREWTLRQKVV